MEQPAVCNEHFEEHAYNLWHKNSAATPQFLTDMKGNNVVPSIADQIQHPLMSRNKTASCAFMYDTERTIMNLKAMHTAEPTNKLIYHVFRDLLTNMPQETQVVKVYDPFDPTYQSTTQTSNEFKQFQENSILGIPLAKVELSYDNIMTYLTKEKLQDILMTMANDVDAKNEHSCTPDPSIKKHKLNTQTPPIQKDKPCVYDRYNLPSMKREGVVRGWDDGQYSAAVNIFTEDQTNVMGRVHICQQNSHRQMDTEKEYWGRSHPNRRDGMPCSIVDAMPDNIHATKDNVCSNCDNSANTLSTTDCHKCQRRYGTGGGRDISNTMTVDSVKEHANISENVCSFNTNSDRDQGGQYTVFNENQNPELFKTDKQEYVFNSDIYRLKENNAANWNRPLPGGVCHRIDSGCVTRHDQGNMRKLFKYNDANLPDDMHPVQAAYERVNKNAYTQVSVPRLEEHDARAPGSNLNNERHIVAAKVALPDKFTTARSPKDLEYWWKQDKAMDDLDGNENPSFYQQDSHVWDKRTTTPVTSANSGVQCNVHKITWPAGIEVEAFTLNPTSEWNDVDFDFGHVLYNDRVAFTRHNQQQLLFGHHFHGNGRQTNRQNTVGAPQWSFCEAADNNAKPMLDAKPDANIHWFRKVDFVKTSQKRFGSNLYTWDQDIGLVSGAAGGIEDDTSEVTCRQTLNMKFTGSNEQCRRPKKLAFADTIDSITPSRDVSGPNNYAQTKGWPANECAFDLEPEDITFPDPINSYTKCGDKFCCGVTPKEDTDKTITALQALYCPSNHADIPELKVRNAPNRGTCVPLMCTETDEICASDYGDTKTCKCYNEAPHFMIFQPTFTLSSLRQLTQTPAIVSYIFGMVHRVVVNHKLSKAVPRFDALRRQSCAKAFLDDKITTNKPTVQRSERPSGTSKWTPYKPPTTKCKTAGSNQGGGGGFKGNKCTYTKEIPLSYDGRSSYDVPENPEANAVLQFATCEHLPHPESQDGFDKFDLSVCWEQDVYEPANIRPWWSLSISEMMMNFMDRSTNYDAYVHLLKFQIPTEFSMREFTYPYKEDRECWMGKGPPGHLWLTDKVSMHSYCDVKTAGVSGYQDPNWDTDHVHIDTTSDMNNLQKIIAAGWSNVNKVLKTHVFTEFHTTLHASNAPAINKIMGRHLWYYKDIYDDKSQHPMRFAPCIPGFSTGDDNALKTSAYAHLRPAAQIWDTKKYLHMGGDKQRLITKPTQWSEIDGTPKSYLVACHPKCNPKHQEKFIINSNEWVVACQDCRPMLRKYTTPTGREWTSTTVAGNPPRHGACSYSAVLKTDQYCSSMKNHVFVTSQSWCVAQDTSGHKNSFFPVAGNKDITEDTTIDTGAIFSCAACKQYDNTATVLTNKKKVTDKDNFEHCVGCGIYKQDEANEMVGPYSLNDAEELLHDLRARILVMLTDPTLKHTLRTKLQSTSPHTLSVNDVSGDHRLSSLDNPHVGILLAVEDGKLDKINTNILGQFATFGSMQPPDTGGDTLMDGCSSDNPLDSSSYLRTQCNFLEGFDSIRSRAYEASNMMRTSIEQSCTETKQASQATGVFECAGNITNNPHITRLKQFAAETLRNEYGMSVPTVVSSETIDIILLDDSNNLDWAAGILPFYAKTHRGSDVFVKNLFEFETTCTNEYRSNLHTRERPCVKSNTGQIAVVNPWLGGNYSFYSHLYAKAFGGGSAQGKRTLMGFDMCQVPDSARSGIDSTEYDIVPCAARECLDQDNSNMSVCIPSASINSGIRHELPDHETQESIASVVTTRFVLTPRPNNTLCERMFIRDKTARCPHPQAPLGYVPGDIADVEGHAEDNTPGGTQWAQMKRTDALSLDKFAVHGSVDGVTGPTFADSMWAGRDTQWHLAKKDYTINKDSGAAYALLAVSHTQLGPDYLQLTIDKMGFMYVSTVGLVPSTHTSHTTYAMNTTNASKLNATTMHARVPQRVPMPLWARSATRMVDEDNARINANPVYTNKCTSECAHRHWVCPFVRNGLFGGSRAMRASHPAVVLLTPDPPRMARLYGTSERLGRAHPLVKVRPVHLHEMHEYAQIGNSLFLRRDCATQDSAREAIHRHITIMIRNTVFGLVSDTEILPRESCLPDNTNRMDWPWLAMELRSGQTAPGRNASASVHKNSRRDKRGRMKNFKIWVTGNGNVTRERSTGPVYDDRQHASRTTLDPGGDCHREYLPRVTEKILAQLKQFEKCYVVHSNHSHRTLRCENSALNVSNSMQEIFVLNTTRPHTRSLAHLRSHSPQFSQYAACKAHTHHTKHSAKTFLYAKTSKNGEHLMSEAEHSLSRRQRISPLWSLFQQRTRGSSVQAVFSGHITTPRELWNQNYNSRVHNPRWRTLAVTPTDTAAMHNLSNIIDDQDHKLCPDLRALVDEKYGGMWEGESKTTRDALCHAVLDDIDDWKKEQDCDRAGVSSVDFDICSLSDLQPLCAMIAQFNTQVAGVNAWAMSQTEHTGMLYTPSVFMRTDGMFVWNAIASTYNDLGFVKDGHCADIEDYYSVETAENALEHGFCPGRVMLEIVRLLEIVRKVVVDIVNLISNVFNLVFEFVVGVVFAMMNSDPGSMAQTRASEAFEKCLTLFVDILITYARMLKELMDLVIKWIMNSPLKVIFDIIEEICKIVKYVLGLLVSTLKKINRVIPMMDTATLEDWEANIDGMSCTLILGPCSDTDSEECLAENQKSLVASYCGISILGSDAPVDMFNAYLSDYTCMPNSHCNTIINGEDTIVQCARCEGPTQEATSLMGFGCDLTTKQCACGMADEPSTNCFTTHDCKLAGAMCAVKGSVHSVSYGTHACVSHTGASFCYKDSTTQNRIGECTVYSSVGMDSTKSCTVEELGTELNYAKTGVCLGSEETLSANAPIVEEHACYLYRCANNYDADTPPRCVQVVLANENIAVYKAVWSPSARPGGRRLLDASKRSGSAVLEFLRIAAPRVGLIPETSVCKSLLRACIDTAVVSAACKTCGTQWLFWNMTLELASHGMERQQLTDAAMLDTRDAVVTILLSPTASSCVLVRGPHAFLVLLEDWLQDTRAFANVLHYTRSLHMTLTNMHTGAVEVVRRFHNGQTRRLAPRLQKTSESNTSVVPHIPHTRKLLATPNTPSLFLPAQQAPDFNKITFVYTPVAPERQQLLYKLGVLELPAGLQCIVSGSTVVNNIILDVIKSFERDGWTAKPICNGNNPFEMTCPMLDGAVMHVIESTKVLVRYYAYLAYDTQCLTNMYVSCLPPPAVSFKFVSDAFPRIRARELAVVPVPRVNNGTAENDILIDGGLAALRWALNKLTMSKASIESIFLGFVSLDPMYDNELYESMRTRNEFSIGSLIRDFFVCDLEEVLTCKARNSPLLVILVTNFLLIAAVVVLLPIPSVFVFFLWTLGLTVGVVYMAYGFSPMCSPRIPVCLGEGLFDIVRKYILPERIILSPYLYDPLVCDETLKRLASATADAVCLKSCISSPISVDTVLSALIAMDCAIFQKHALITRFIETRLPDLVRELYDGAVLEQTVRHFELIFTGSDLDLQNAVHVCIMVNTFKIVLLLCFIFVLLPVFFFTLQLILTLGLAIVVKTLALILQIGCYFNNMLLY